jgi:hypothetical protein
MYFFLLSYPLLGAGIKYIDEAFDENIFNKKVAMMIAPLLGLLWAYTMLIDQVSATILLAILCGVFFKGKIDNYAHVIGLLVILMIIFLARVDLLILPLIFLAAAALLDEVGNDTVDKYRNHFKKGNILHHFVICFFEHRWVMKVAILGIVFLNIIPLHFFLAMVLFDYAYVTMNWYSQVRKGTSNGFPQFKHLKLKESISFN